MTARTKGGGRPVVALDDALADGRHRVLVDVVLGDIISDIGIGIPGQPLPLLPPESQTHMSTLLSTKLLHVPRRIVSLIGASPGCSPCRRRCRSGTPPRTEARESRHRTWASRCNRSPMHALPAPDRPSAVFNAVGFAKQQGSRKLASALPQSRGTGARRARETDATR